MRELKAPLFHVFKGELSFLIFKLKFILVNDLSHITSYSYALRVKRPSRQELPPWDAENRPFDLIIPEG